ncbi:MAG: hypothetical protein A3G49_01770 [Candidatus Sungbacteria bacterium RIFCSPLOWO2_12_FULL_41_11]|uniref:Uncharacterized protein n=1 Tax=Candidatus Sungbacteria bacterium RIFCSPLOWO2_12_FULL_41_11 TaxID=1802286 RepID=A0A1G2LRV3_9BACT|nr:MAG: hypothetical protein A3D41_00975 [Candidatus Sungbacteria bacterium RIFCSPHIGHO2_02_FULL_41_12b]OHA13599.1 MAG: hypothetical protein A3G49_01770 [Candidatus Sungbacteria bacterium RIFCSPLOWO2_12_FULL_41_11]
MNMNPVMTPAPKGGFFILLRRIPSSFASGMRAKRIILRIIGEGGYIKVVIRLRKNENKDTPQLCCGEYK